MSPTPLLVCVAVAASLVLKAPAAHAIPQDQQQDPDLTQALKEALEEAGAQDPDAPPPAPGPTVAGFLSGLQVSLDVLTAVGGSTERGEELEALQGGGHDPRRRGFTFQQAELSLMGAVDSYFFAEAHFITYLDVDSGETQYELEEAFATTTSLPHGLEVEAGQFFTEFGRHNPQHPHQWEWQDAPVVNTRMFGGDGLRGPGVRLGWLVPLPWFSEVHLGVQNADGEQMTSFLGGFGHHHGHEEDEDEDEEGFEGISGRPTVDRDRHGLGDFAWHLRWANSWELSDTTTGLLGVSGIVGPNESGDDGNTWIVGADWTMKWRPADQHQGWPFLVWQTEWMFRNYRADSVNDAGDPTDPTDDLRLPHQALEDWGAYSQVLWGFRQRWATGLRMDVASGSFQSLLARDEDPRRDDRVRWSPLLMFQPTEYSRLRLQYNYDCADHLDDDAHSVWLGFEFSFGSHAAHGF